MGCKFAPRRAISGIAEVAVPQALISIRERRFTLTFGTTITIADNGGAPRPAAAEVALSVLRLIGGWQVRPGGPRANTRVIGRRAKSARGRQAERRTGTGFWKMASRRKQRGAPQRGGRRTRQDQISARHCRR